MNNSDHAAAGALLESSRSATAAREHMEAEREVLDRSSSLAHTALEATMRRADEAQALVDDYDSRMTATRNALTAAGVPDVEGNSPTHRALDVAERIGMLARERDGAREMLADALRSLDAAEAPLTDIVLRHHAAMSQVERERDEARAALTAATERAVKAEKERDEADSTASFVLRPEVAAFAMLMEEKLLLNDHRPGWKNDDVLALVARLHEETRELVRAIRDPSVWRAAGRYPQHVEIGREAADVANFAMMIADVCGALDEGVLRARARIAAHLAGRQTASTPSTDNVDTAQWVDGKLLRRERESRQ